MKKLVITIITVILFSCNNQQTNYTEQKSFYSTETDTIYKRNSIEVDYIDRTFFEIVGGNPKESKLTENRNKQLEISNNIGTEVFVITIYNSTNIAEEYGTAIFNNKKQFESFLDDLYILINNPKKSLDYYINHNEYHKYQGSISNSFFESEGVYVVLFLEGPLEDSSCIFYLKQNDISSLKHCYEKYILETIK